MQLFILLSYISYVNPNYQASISILSLFMYISLAVAGCTTSACCCHVVLMRITASYVEQLDMISLIINIE